jgi:hypothetical protein
LTAYSQDKTTLKSWQVDSLINATLQSKEWERASEFYRTAFMQMADKWREAERKLDTAYENTRIRDSAWRKHAGTLDSSRVAHSRRADLFEQKYYGEYNRKRKPMGLSLQTGFNPFTKTMYAGVGLHITLIGFNLFPKGKEIIKPVPGATDYLRKNIWPN